MAKEPKDRRPYGLQAFALSVGAIVVISPILVSIWPTSPDELRIKAFDAFVSIAPYFIGGLAGIYTVEKIASKDKPDNGD